MKVWIVETGEYEQRDIWGVYASSKAAVAGIKKDYGPPYRVAWHEPKEGWSGEGIVLTGDFGSVMGKSTKHIAHFDIYPVKVQS